MQKGQKKSSSGSPEMTEDQKRTLSMLSPIAKVRHQFLPKVIELASMGGPQGPSTSLGMTVLLVSQANCTG